MKFSFKMFFLINFNFCIFKGGTNTAEALNTANNIILLEANGMRPLKEGIPKIVLVITDGASNDKIQTLAAADMIKKREFNIISIGVGNINKEELTAMSTTVNDFYFVDNFDKILSIIQEIARTTCQQPAEVEQETNFVNEVAKDSYKYFKYPSVTEKNFTIHF